MFRPFSNIWENFKEYIVLVVLIIICLFTLSINQKPAAKKVKSLAFGALLHLVQLFLIFLILQVFGARMKTA